MCLYGNEVGYSTAYLLLGSYLLAHHERLKLGSLNPAAGAARDDVEFALALRVSAWRDVFQIS